MRFLITAGPTREPIDAVRFIGNRASGRMGLALARAAAVREHAVTLLLGPVCGPVRLGPAVSREDFETTAELAEALDRHRDWFDVLVMAAAVADQRPARPIEGKHARGDGAMQLTLEPTPDLVARVSDARQRAAQRVIAFSLEADPDPRPRARRKLEEKGVDAIVANSVGAMEGARARCTWIPADGAAEDAPSQRKSALGRWLIARAEALARGARSTNER
jgi:phosphopantothenoylcysteine decarboxylase/phosphopantothenate--cysteine ligase